MRLFLVLSDGGTEQSRGGCQPDKGHYFAKYVHGELQALSYLEQGWSVYDLSNLPQVVKGEVTLSTETKDDETQCTEPAQPNN